MYRWILRYRCVLHMSFQAPSVGYRGRNALFKVGLTRFQGNVVHDASVGICLRVNPLGALPDATGFSYIWRLLHLAYIYFGHNPAPLMYGLAFLAEHGIARKIGDIVTVVPISQSNFFTPQTVASGVAPPIGAMNFNDSMITNDYLSQEGISINIHTAQSNTATVDQAGNPLLQGDAMTLSAWLWAANSDHANTQAYDTQVDKVHLQLEGVDNLI